MELYRELAMRSETLQRIGREHPYYRTHFDRLDELIKKLPSGSGFDGKWDIEYVNRNGREGLKLQINFAFMDSNGFYDCYRDLLFTVAPSLVHGFDLSIYHIPSKHVPNYKDYILQTLSDSLSSMV